MRNKIVGAVIVMGFSGLIAQIVLLRELMIAFRGNELSIGVILANWLLLESAGAYFLGRKVSRARQKLSWFIVVTLLFSLFFVAAIHASRVFRDFMAVLPGEGLGILPMFYLSFLILLPVSLLHGALFTLGCELYYTFSKPQKSKAPEDSSDAVSIARVYIYETLGTIAGGVILTYLFIPYLHSFNIALLLALLNTAICALLMEPFWNSGLTLLKRAAGLLTMVLLAFIAFALIGSLGDRIELYSVKQQWGSQNLLHYQNSNYGNIAVVERENEYTFFSDGIPVITSPNPDIIYIEEFVHFAMLSHPSPEHILILSGGAGGVINEVLKHDVKKIEYSEVDPVIPEVVRKFPTPLTEQEFEDDRVVIRDVDGRFYLKRTTAKYDVIFSGFNDPSTLQTNRFFTREFYAIANEKLTADGVLVIGVPGSLTHLSPEIADLNAMVLNTLQTIFQHIRVIPGDGTNFYIASQSPKISGAGSELLAERLNERELQLNLITPGYLEYRLDSRWPEWFYGQMEGSSDRVNSDFRPLGVFYSLVYWNEKFSPAFNRYFKLGGYLNIYHVLGVILLLAGFFAIIGTRLRAPLKPALTICIFSTGFAGMLFDLILIFAFQVLYGYVFYWLGLLVAAFMAGVMGGGLWMTAYLKKKNTAIFALIKLEVILTVFAFLLPFVFVNAGNLLAYEWFDHILKSIFLILSFLSGILVGAEFPLANREYLKILNNLSSTAGSLYSADLMGGWLGGITGAILLLPVLGLHQTAMVIVFLKICSLLLLILAAKRQYS